MVKPTQPPNGLFVRLLREAAGVSRESLAERMGISYSYLANIEAGRRPLSASHLHTAEHALGLEPGRLEPLLATEPQDMFAGKPEFPSPAIRDAYRLALQDIARKGTTVGPPLGDARLESEISAWNRRNRVEAKPRRRSLTRDEMELTTALGGPDGERLSSIAYLSQLVQQLDDRSIELLIAFAKGLAKDTSRMYSPPVQP